MIDSNKAYQMNALFINFLLMIAFYVFFKNYFIAIGLEYQAYNDQHTSQTLYDRLKRLSLSPRLAAEHTHTGYVDPNKSPSHQVLKRSQCSHKCVGVGAV